MSEGGVKKQTVTLSKSSTRRASEKVRRAGALVVKTSFEAPKYATLHWDGKIIPNDGERIAVLIAGMPNHKEGKLLGVPVVANGTGTTQANVSYNLIKQWAIHDNIVGLVFDTTASNSGKKNGACVKLEKLINRKLYYFACRHHVLERIQCAVWQELFGKTCGPERLEFKEFQKSWAILSDKTSYKTLHSSLFSDSRTKHQKDKVVQFLHQMLSGTKLSNLNAAEFPASTNRKEQMIRDDYRECAELMLILLDQNPLRGVHWLQPGAYHHARWLSCVLYTAKMYAFSAHMKYDETKIDNLRRICTFNALLYVKAWLSATSAADAPGNDLDMWIDLSWYKEVDSDDATVALNALNRHFWYLTEEIAPFSLFSDHVTDNEKREIARQLLKFNSEKLLTGVPTFPPLLSSSTKLYTLLEPSLGFSSAISNWTQIGCDYHQSTGLNMTVIIKLPCLSRTARLLMTCQNEPSNLSLIFLAH